MTRKPMLEALKLRGERKRIAECLCARISERAREPVFFRSFAVADTIDGRFDLVVLHAWLVLEVLEARREAALAQALVDALFARFDDALREQGAGDMGMNRRIRKMAGAFYGRLRAYREAGSESALAAAISRNLYRGETSQVELAGMLAKYALDARAGLASLCLDRGHLDFGPLPAPAGTKA
ncbi:MAG TPA: ubiquinol-cytochrome C chaperone family protein [Rhizomicrobium sp.]|nr:ubiquinol-cytochrome C chaperone family protein [Rhizomicrobium sp.]